MQKSQEIITNDLHILWNNFIQDEDDQKKKKWVQLFLYEFQFLDQTNLSIGTSTFLNNVAFQLTSYMLQLVYGIICDSLTEESATAAAKSTDIADINSKPNPETYQENYNDNTKIIFSQLLNDNADFSYKNCSLSQLILDTPNDITAIISLRKFLMHGLGGKILDFLQNCDIKFLTSRKIFATLLMNLFPSNSWENTQQSISIYHHSEAEQLLEIEKFVNDFVLIQTPSSRKSIKHNKNNLKEETNDDQYVNFFPITTAAAAAVVAATTSNPTTSPALNVHYEIIDIEYNKAEFQVFMDAIIKTTDEIALLLLNLLIQIIQDECTLNLDINAITIDCFQFALDCIINIETTEAFQIDNRNYLKLKLMKLIECCLNNLFMKSFNYELIDYPNIIAKLMQSLENSFPLHNAKVTTSDDILMTRTTQIQRITIYEINYLIFGIINNFLIISKYKNDKIDELFQWFNEQKIDNTIEILNIMLHANNNIEERQFESILIKKTINIIIQIIENIKMFNTKHMQHKNRKKTNKVHQKATISQQNYRTMKQLHCKKNQIPPCLFEKILIRIFSNLLLDCKELILKSFQKNGICCCLYNIEIINLLMLKHHQYEHQIQKNLYKFLATRVLKTIFIHKNSCNICELKRKSYELHLNLFQLYKNKYLIMQNIAADLLIFLKHLLKISNALTFDISSRILVDIILPVFRKEKSSILSYKQQKLSIDDALNRKCLSLNIVLECLNIFMNYLNDLRLIKGFFNEENVQYLEDLLYIPELSKAVCDLIRIGLENVSFLGDNQDQQVNLSHRLVTIPLNSIEYCSSFFMILIQKLHQSSMGKNLEIYVPPAYENMNLINPIKLLFDEDKLKIPEILYMKLNHWNLSLQLYKSNLQFRQHFQLKYPNNMAKPVKQENELCILYENTLFNIVYNILSTFLYYSNIHKNQKTVAATRNENYINILDMNNFESIEVNTTTSNCLDYLSNNGILNETTTIFLRSTDKIDNTIIIDAKNVNTSLTNIDNGISLSSAVEEDGTFHEITSKFYDTTAIFLRSTDKIDNTIIIDSKNMNTFPTNIDKGITLSSAVEEDGTFHEITSKFYDTTAIFDQDQTFLSSLKSSADSDVVYFDINNQKKIKYNQTGYLTTVLNYTYNSLKNRLPFIFTSNNSTEEKIPANEDINIQEICRKDEELLYLCQFGDGKSVLLKLFETTLNAFILHTFEQQLEEDIKMDQYLQQLKIMLLSNCDKYWGHIENSNAIIQVLQSLLKVAEMANKVGVVVNNSENNENKHSMPLNMLKSKTSSANGKVTDDDATIISGRISFASDDMDYHSSKASCTQQESEIEMSDNETEEYYATADEGYDADAEIQEISEPDDKIEELWNTFTPSSRFRSHFVHEGICKIIVEILIVLSEKCINDPGFWANRLSQLANRLFVIRKSLGGSLFLLKGFSAILKCNDAHLKEFQQSILDLITDLNSPEVLSAYLGILATKNPPVEILIKYMAHISITGIHVHPKAEIVFPIETDGSINSTCNPLLFENIEKIRNYHEYHKVETPFSVAACILPITHAKIWNNSGFTISTWIQLKNNSAGITRVNNGQGQQIDEDWPNIHAEPSLSHIISLGSNQLMLSVYVNSNSRLVFETSKPNAEINIGPQSIPNKETEETPQTCKNKCVFRRKRSFYRNLSQTPSGQPMPASNKENLSPISSQKLTSVASGSHEKSPLVNALKNTKSAILNSFGQFSFFSSPNDADILFESSSIELKHFHFASNKWTHLCFSIEIKPGFLNVTTIVDGSQQYSLTLPCSSLQNLIKIENFQVACIGQIFNNNLNMEDDTSSLGDRKLYDVPIQYGISNFLIFDRVFNTKSMIANLTALGPDATNLTQCQIGNSIPNYGLLNFKKGVRLTIDKFQESIKILKQNLIVAYSVHEPKLFTGFEKCVELTNPNVCDFGVIYFGLNLVPENIPSIQTATILCGGLSSLLFLFARVVELSNDSNVQAIALNILLSVALSDSNLYTEFVKKDYLNLISYVVRTDQSSKDVNLLKSIINNACNQDVLIARSKLIQINENTDACIIYPNLLLNVIRRYCDWYRSGSKESKVLDNLLKCIQGLVREKHPHQLFNLKQLSNVGLLKELFNLCKIYIIESPNPVYISIQAAESLVSILSTFAGSPPSPSLLDEIMKLLLLLQKPSDCFVTHDRSKFYFLISPDPPIKHKRISLPLPSKQLRQLMRDRKKSVQVPSTSHSTGMTDFRKSSSREKFSDKEKTKTSFSRLSSERQPTNFSNILLNFNSIESIANCKRLDKNVISKLTTQQIGSPSRSVSLYAKSPKRHLKVAVNRSRQKDNKNRIQKVHRAHSARTISNSEDNENLMDDNECNKPELSLAKGLAAIELLAPKGYDIVDSDEISSLDNLENSVKFSPTHNRSKTLLKSLRKSEFYNSHGVMRLQEGLFTLLRDFLLILPDNLIGEVLTHYVKLEILLVLANHRNASVRAAIIRLLSVLCDRLSSAELQAISKKCYWHHCANQISIHHADKNLCEACIQWITGVICNLDDILLIDGIKVNNIYGVQTFLAIFPQTIDDDEVSTRVFQFTKKLYVEDPTNNTILIENGLLQVVVKTLYKICMTLKPINLNVQNSIVELLSAVAVRSIQSSGQINILWDILSLLSFYQDNDISVVIRGFRSVQATLLKHLFFIYLMKSNFNIKNKIYKPQLPDSKLSAAEMRTRFELLVDRSSQFFITSDSSVKPTEPEIKLFRTMVSLGNSGYGKFNNFIAWGLLPSRPVDLRMYIVNSLWDVFSKESNTSIVCDGKMFRSLLWLFLNEEKPQTDNIEFDNLNKLSRKLGISESDFWNIEGELDKIEMNRENLITKQKPAIEKIVFKYETYVQSCIDSSMIITRIVAELQNSERKSLMSQMKERDESYIFQEWMGVIQRMTHEGAPWFNDSNYSRSWELDDTEGPARVRNRLKRCELDLDSRFIMKEYYQQLVSKAQPLDFLIVAGDQQMNISLNSQILHNFPAKYLPVDGEIDGELVVTDKKLFFIATYRCKFFYRYCDIQRITEIWTKRYQHEECGFEIFLESNRSLFFALHNQEDWKTMKEIFYDKIIQNLDSSKILLITQQWKEGLLTNWEYLMTLNQISGRTYNDLMQYPVFPWILSNYSANVLDLTDIKSFRKFEKPIAIQHENNESHYINNYNYINNTMASMGAIKLSPYHYSSHYSNSGTVLHFLVRVPPFTNYFLRYQDNNFDLPDRTFHSLNTTWRLASNDSSTDIKELIPEFFCLPEMFENFEKFNFGNRQSGEAVCNVELPPWCLNDARTFVFIHRQALESEIVRNNLHNWIDLIFGYKQTGQAAVDAINVFHPATYPDFSISAAEDPIERNAVETMIKTYGQMPKQLLKSAHPASKHLNYCLGKSEAMATVKGLRWGAFTGSPQLPHPTLNSIEKCSGFETLISFSNTNVVYVVPGKCCVMQGPENDIYNLISWYHNDKLIRIQSLSEFGLQAKPLIYNNPFDEITICGSDPYSNTLWCGHKSGKISVYQCINNDSNKRVKSRQAAVGGIKLSYNSAFRKVSTKSNPKFSEEYEASISDSNYTLAANTNLQSADQMAWTGPIVLIRHTDQVTCIYISTEFKIAVSAAKDGLAVIWDINNFNYIRTIQRPSEIRLSPITLVTVSPTLGDIITVHSIEKQSRNSPNKNEDECFEATENSLDDFVNVSINPNGKSIMRLHSVNAKYVNHLIHEDKILSICYSYIKEGVGINVIAGGIEGGVIRLWSSWNLAFVKEIFIRPEIVSLTFSTYQHLIALTKDGYIQVWESEGLCGNPPKFPQHIFHK